MRCPNCASELEDGVLFCRDCGSRVEGEKKRFCRDCGAPLSDGAKFCGKCGSSIAFATSAAIGREMPPARKNEGSRVEPPTPDSANEARNVQSEPSASAEHPNAEIAKRGPGKGEKAKRGLLGNLAAVAQGALDNKRKEAHAAAEKKSREQDQEWAYQLRIKQDYAGTWSGFHSREALIRDGEGRELYTVEAKLFSHGRRVIIRDSDDNVVASMKTARFKGLENEGAVVVKIGENTIGRVVKRKTGSFDGHDWYWHFFEPLGLRLYYEGGLKNGHYTIRNSMHELLAVIHRCKMREEDTRKINYNCESDGLLYAIMILAADEIDQRALEH